jgi:hypothetical protein
MEHLLLKATAVAADQGQFEAVISTATPDREKDVVEPAAVLAAMKSYGERRLPLAWAHSGDAANQIGYVEPSTARVEGSEVLVKGWIDQATDAGAHAWRLVKMGTLGFSYGYLITAAKGRQGGGRNITGLDIFEVTATPTPMNADPRVTSYKGTKQADQPPTASQLRILNSMIGQAQEYIAAEVEAEDAAEMAEILDTLEELRGEPATGEDETAGVEKSVDKLSPADSGGDEEPREARTLRETALKVALEIRTGGLSDRPPRVKETPEPPRTPEMDPETLRDYSRDLMVKVLSGSRET